MKKYTIELQGKGKENFIFFLSEEEKKLLNNQEINTDEEAYSLLNIDSIEECDKTIIGYNINDLNVVIKNFNDDVIWESNSKYNFEKINVPIYETDLLIIEDNFEGILFNYELELEKDVEPEKISFIVSTINDEIEILTDLEYDGIPIHNFKNQINDYEMIGTSVKLL